MRVDFLTWNSNRNCAEGAASATNDGGTLGWGQPPVVSSNARRGDTGSCAIRRSVGRTDRGSKVSRNRCSKFSTELINETRGTWIFSRVYTLIVVLLFSEWRLWRKFRSCCGRSFWSKLLAWFARQGKVVAHFFSIINSSHSTNPSTSTLMSV